MPADTPIIHHPLADEEVGDAGGYVREQLADIVAFEAEYNDLRWDEDLRRLEEPGESIPAEEAFAEIRARLEARASRAK